MIGATKDKISQVYEKLPEFPIKKPAGAPSKREYNADFLEATPAAPAAVPKDEVPSPVSAATPRYENVADRAPIRQSKSRSKDRV